MKCSASHVDSTEPPSFKFESQFEGFVSSVLGRHAVSPEMSMDEDAIHYQYPAPSFHVLPISSGMEWLYITLAVLPATMHPSRLAFSGEFRNVSYHRIDAMFRKAGL